MLGCPSSNILSKFMQNLKEFDDGVQKLKTTGFVDFVIRPEIWILENTTFRKLDLLLSSGEGKKTSTLSGLLEGANLNHWTTHVKVTVLLRPTVTRPVLVSEIYLAPAINFSSLIL
jgi:hypothetical protein